MHVGVIGGGNIGTLIAGQAAHQGHQVTVVTNSPERWSTEIAVVDAVTGNDFHAVLSRVTNDPSHLRTCHYVFLTVPPEVFSHWVDPLLKVLGPSNTLVVVPGSGGAEIFFNPLIKAGVCVYGLQRVPYIARLDSYGHRVRILGTKQKLYGAAVPADRGCDISTDLATLFETPTETLATYLAVTLTPSNPILHTSRLYSLFRDYDPESPYERIPLFYEDWDDDASRVLLTADEELQAVCKAFPELDLSGVESLSTYYEGSTPAEITATITGIRAFKGLETPHRQVRGGFVPEWESRYFTTDFPYGLHILIQFGQIARIPTPMMDEIWAWYCSVGGEHAHKRVTLPFDSPRAVVEFYH
ncbi:MAG: NAD/NADP octopine/nopaline dehydrogenase family protein [Actinomycetaceae bacterium]|nr:NAD/NADP octopine/nopaline dehydrogenase family protein [Actinomycetaceae bacterium]